MEEQSAAGICVSAYMSLPKVARKGSKPATTERFQLPAKLLIIPLRRAHSSSPIERGGTSRPYLAERHQVVGCAEGAHLWRSSTGPRQQKGRSPTRIWNHSLSNSTTSLGAKRQSHFRRARSSIDIGEHVASCGSRTDTLLWLHIQVLDSIPLPDGCTDLEQLVNSWPPVMPHTPSYLELLHLSLQPTNLLRCRPIFLFNWWRRWSARYDH